MILNSVTSLVSFPNEKLAININDVDPPLETARVGVRFPYYYYDNEKYFTGTDMFLESENSGDGVDNNFYQPTNFSNIPEDFPVYWDTSTDQFKNHYLYLTFLGGLSSLTVHPSQPYPIIRKISNNQIVMSGGFLPFQAYEGEKTKLTFRQDLDLNLVEKGSDEGLTFYGPYGYRSRTRRQYLRGSLKNATRSYKANLWDNIIRNSFSITVPLVSAKNEEDDYDTWIYTLYHQTSQEINHAGGVTTTTLAGLTSEDLESATGITYPYFSTRSINYDTGRLTLVPKAPLWIGKNEDITVSYQTSSLFTGWSSSTISPNYFSITTTEPVYFYNYRWMYSHASSPSTRRDAFTISFNPSAGIIDTRSNPFSGITAVDIGTKFIDNFFQTTYDINVNRTKAVKRFVERTDDFRLSAIDIGTNIRYRNNKWMPASATMRFVNNGIANNHTVGIQVSTFTGAIYECYEDINFILNGKTVTFELTLNQFDDNSARISTFILPSPDESLPIKWSVYPPENIILQDVDTEETIEQNVEFPGGNMEIDVLNLGVDKTEITLYSKEYDVSASVVWYPSSSIYSNMRPVILSNISDKDPTNVGTLSAMIIRNGMIYRVPEDSSIVWSEAVDSSKGILNLKTRDDSIDVVDSTIYPSNINYSTLNVSFSSLPIISNPPEIGCNIECNIFDENIDFHCNKMLYFRQYPDHVPLYMEGVSSTSTNLIDSRTISNIVHKIPTTWSLSAKYPELIVGSSSDIKWIFNNSTGTSRLSSGDICNVLSNTLSSSVQIYTKDARPFFGNFKDYNFYDTINFYILSTIQPLDYIAFPSKLYYSDELLNYTNYNDSQGMSSLKACKNETFFLSASPGFDLYVWDVYGKSTSSDTNTTTIQLNYSEVSSSSGNIFLSAFNNIFIPTDKKTIYNFTSSNGSNIFKQPITFIDYPTASASLSLDNTLYDIDRYSTSPIASISFDTGFISLESYNTNLVLSSIDGIQVLPIIGNETTFEKKIQINTLNSPFYINENSFNIFNVFLSGNMNVKYDDGNCSTEKQTILSNMVQLTAFDGPNLDLYTNKNIVSSGEIVTFFNPSNTSFSDYTSLKFDSFVFFNGESDTFTTTSNILTTEYITDGIYSPSLTGVLNDGRSIVVTWPKMISVMNTNQEYSDKVATINDDIIFPYSRKETEISANSWQYADTINQSFERLKTNLEYLSAKCTMYNSNFPIAYGGFLGQSYGNFKWDTYDRIPNITESNFDNITCGTIVNDKLICMNAGWLEIYDISESPELLYRTNKINNNELFGNIIKIQYNDGSLFLLDSTRKMLFILDFDIDSFDSSLSHYWGGIGERDDSTKFNNPVDLCISNGIIYVLDSAGSTIKTYNSNFNWITNISVDASTLSMSVNFNKILVTYSDYCKLYTLSGELISTIYKNNLRRGVINPLHDGIIYLITSDNIHKYGISGNEIANANISSVVNDIIFDRNHNYILYTNNLYKFVDYLILDDIFGEVTHNIVSDWSDVWVKETEFVTSLVFNDSCKKIHDKFKIFNNSLAYKFNIQKDEYDRVINQSIISLSSTELPDVQLLYVNEPVLYNTINRSIHSLYDALSQLKDNISMTFTYPNNNNNLEWVWKTHYIDNIQRPSLNKNPVSWRELKSSKITNNTTLSSVSAWYTIRDGSIAGNHSEICWNYQYIQNNSYFPLTWEQTEFNNVSGHVLNWEYLESNCCESPEEVFPDCKTVCP